MIMGIQTVLILGQELRIKRLKKFWNWKSRMVTNQATMEQTEERTLFLNGTIAEDSWYDDDVTPQLFKDELMGGSGNITVWINSPGGSELPLVVLEGGSQ